LYRRNRLKEILT